jgi:hypothetical protein
MRKMKKASYNKEKMKELYKKPELYRDPDNLTRVSLINGSCLLNLEKKKKNGEFYSNPNFNKALRRRFNIKPEQFELVYNGYKHFRNLFKNKKSMKKYIKKIQRREHELQRQNFIRKQNESASQRSTEDSGTKV